LEKIVHFGEDTSNDQDLPTIVLAAKLGKLFEISKFCVPDGR
jgi:hypothetical protein